jgi:hypothetical protein
MNASERIDLPDIRSRIDWSLLADIDAEDIRSEELYGY